MQDARAVAGIRRKFRLLTPEMDERRRRQWAAAEAREIGWGGVTLVARATGLSRPTIMSGMRELKQPSKQRALEAARIRRAGGGRKRLVITDAGLLAALEALIEPVTRGDPESPLRWTCKSTRRLADELARQRHPVGPRTVAALLHEAGYSLQANRKTREGSSHPDRNAQFEHINAQVEQKRCQGAEKVSGTGFLTEQKRCQEPFFLTGRPGLVSGGDGKSEADGRWRVGVPCVEPHQCADADL